MIALKKVFFASLLSACSVLQLAAADTIVVDGLKYTINSTGNNTVTVCGLDDVTIAEVVIPQTVSIDSTVYEVSQIGGLAFQNCAITSITISSTVTRVNKKAFDGCTSLSKVIIDDGVSALYLSNDYSYEGDSDRAEGKSIFSSCPLKEVYIGRDLTYPSDNSQGYSPFARKNIDKAVIGPNVTVLNRNLFWDCMALKEITFSLGSALTTIEDEALSNCGLETLSLPDATIEFHGEFRQCKSLSRIHFGKSLKTIPLSFFRFNSLKEIDVDPDNQTFYSENGILYSNDKKILLRAPLAANEANILPVETIASGAFRDCCELQTLIFPTSVKTIERYAVTGCTKLTSIIVPENVQTIGEGALGTYYYRMSESWFNDGADLYTFNSPQGYIICKSQTPPTTDSETFHGREAWTLWLPEGSANSYAIADGWKSFANVIEGPCHINVSCNIATAGEISGEGDYLPGDEVKLTVIPKESDKYDFVGWCEGDSILCTDFEYNFTLLHPINEITAKFEPIPDAANDEVDIRIIDGHLIIDIRRIENAKTYITDILKENGDTIASVKAEITMPATPSTTAREISEVLNPSDNYIYHVKIYDGSSSLLAHYTGKLSGTLTGIDDICPDDNGTEATYYNLQGVMVANPTDGLYIVRRGNTVSKEHIR